MTHLIDLLAVELPTSDGSAGEGIRYSERLSYNVTPGGRPAVVASASGQVRTVTEIRAEDDDFESTWGVRTKTEAKPEGDDLTSESHVRTSTKAAPEDDDFLSSSGERLIEFGPSVSGATKTKTFVEKEADDWTD
jgi:hypothetical protein